MKAQMELAGRSMKGQRKQADRLGARWLAVLGETVTLRNMETGDEIDLGEGAELIARIHREESL